MLRLDWQAAHCQLVRQSKFVVKESVTLFLQQEFCVARKLDFLVGETDGSNQDNPIFNVLALLKLGIFSRNFEVRVDLVVAAVAVVLVMGLHFSVNAVEDHVFFDG